MSKEGAAGSTLTSALEQAQSIVEAAEQRAAEIRQDAERTYQEAREQGYRDGFKQGHADVAQDSVRMLEESSVVGERLAEEATRLAFAICAHVVSDHVKAKPETIKKIALKALQESTIVDVARITVHPDDSEYLKSMADELKRITSGANVIIETDPSMSRGGCIVKTDFGEVDGSIEALLAAISARLKPKKK